MVPSLLALSTKVCIKHVQEIWDIGQAPYLAIRSVLMRVDDPRQLRQLELNSPHILGDDAECWLRLIEKRFRGLHIKHNFQPEHPGSWHKIYARYERYDAEEKAAATAKLKNDLAGIDRSKQGKTSSIVSFDRTRMAPPPRDGRAPVQRVRGPGRFNDNSDLRFSGGTKTKTTTAKSILNKAKREAQAITARNRLATPTGALPVRQGQIMRAPQGMIDDHRKKSQPRIKPPTTVNAVRPMAPGRRRDPALEAREDRLRSFTKAGAKSYHTILYDADLEDEEGLDGAPDDSDGAASSPVGTGLTEEDLERLFSEDEKPSKPSSSASGQRKRGGLLSNRPGANASKSSRAAASPVKAEPESKQKPLAAVSSRGSRMTEPVSPPARIKTEASSQPAAGHKRKTPDIFMKPKAKVLRR